jgi:hypothetical protein
MGLLSGEDAYRCKSTKLAAQASIFTGLLDPPSLALLLLEEAPKVFLLLCPA